MFRLLRINTFNIKIGEKSKKSTTFFYQPKFLSTLSPHNDGNDNTNINFVRTISSWEQTDITHWLKINNLDHYNDKFKWLSGGILKLPEFNVETDLDISERKDVLKIKALIQGELKREEEEVKKNQKKKKKEDRKNNAKTIHVICKKVDDEYDETKTFSIYSSTNLEQLLTKLNGLGLIDVTILFMLY